MIRTDFHGVSMKRRGNSAPLMCHLFFAPDLPTWAAISAALENNAGKPGRVSCSTPPGPLGTRILAAAPVNGCLRMPCESRKSPVRSGWSRVGNNVWAPTILTCNTGGGLSLLAKRGLRARNFLARHGTLRRISLWRLLGCENPSQLRKPRICGKLGQSGNQATCRIVGQM